MNAPPTRTPAALACGNRQALHDARQLAELSHSQALPLLQLAGSAHSQPDCQRGRQGVQAAQLRQRLHLGTGGTESRAQPSLHGVPTCQASPPACNGYI